MKRIAIVGHGYVGRAMEDFFKGKFDIVLYDPPQGFSDKAAVNACDLAIVSVPTVQSADGSADLSLVEETFSWLTTPLVVLKSTVPPGTTARLAQKYKLEEMMIFSPEFIGEGGYPVPHWEGVPHPTEMKLHKAFIFGGSKIALEKILPFFTRVRGPFAEYRMTDATTAELMKYMVNCWIATKITFCNEFYDIAKTFGVSYDELRELWLTDGRVGRSHTIVYPDKRGFDGKCIPKDISATVYATDKAGYDATFLKAAITKNESLRRNAAQ
jgi:UDPglucose 6-dehydrogenase